MVEDVLQALITGILQGGVYALISIGLALIFGVLKIINFAQAEFLMLGMFATYFLGVQAGIDPLVSFFLLIPVFFLVGVGVHKLTIESLIGEQEESQLVLTFGLLLIIQNGVLAVLGPNHRLAQTAYGRTAFDLGPFTLNQARTYAFVFAMLATVATFVFLNRTELGRAIRATANNADLAQYAGIDVDRIYTIAFGIGIALTGSAGALIVTYYPVYPAVGFEFVVIMFLAVVLGGLGSIKGAAIAGLGIGIFERLAVLWLPLSLQPSMAFVLFLLVIMVKPEGLFGTQVEGA